MVRYQVALYASLLVLGCGGGSGGGGDGGGDGGGCPEGCATPPSPECVDGNIRTYTGAGTCEGSQCVYPSIDDPCLYGCTDAACRQYPPDLVDRSDRLHESQRSTTDVQMVDLDGDGRLDVVWLSQPWDDDLEGGIDITFNLGGGRFEGGQPPSLVELGSWTFVRPVDVDADGDPDLILTRPARTSAQVAILINDGTGGLDHRPELTPALEGETYGHTFGRVTLGDVNGDSNLDMVVPISLSLSMDDDMPNVLLLGDGTGAFALDTEGRLPAIEDEQDYTFSAVLEDFTGDGHIDLVLGEAERQSRLLVNDGTGRFVDETLDDGAGRRRMPEQLFRAYGLEIADVNEDGAQDLVVVNDVSTSTGEPVTQGSYLLINDGSGHFSEAPLPLTDSSHDTRGLAFGDFNRDGHMDIVIGNGVDTVDHGGTAIEILFGAGDGVFTPNLSVPSFSVGIFGVAAGDLNGDGYDDVAAATAEPDGSGDLSNVLLLTE